MAHNRLLPNEIPDAAPARAPRFSFDPVTHGFAVGYMTTPATRALHQPRLLRGQSSSSNKFRRPSGEAEFLELLSCCVGYMPMEYF